MAKIQFNIKFRSQIESGEYKVEIGKSDPWPARIACWDLNGNDLIVIVSNPEGKEEGLIYTPEGKHKAYAPKIDSDLFIVTPEPELSEFEKNLSDIFGYAISMSVSDPKKPTDEFVREYAPELLAIARKQLQPEIDAEIEKAYKTADEVQYRKGREEALKDLPRWKKIRENGRNYSDSPQFVINGRYLEMNDTLNDVYEIALSDLAKLPKEDSHE